MSDDDIATERGIAPSAFGATGLPLVGMTIGSDAVWSSRSWQRVGPGQYTRQEAESVRVVGQNLSTTYHPRLRPPPKPIIELERTVSAWGAKTQADIARTRIGIVGVGSVGSIVAEILVRSGVSDVTLIDPDRVEFRNLDRMIHATREDAKSKRLKVDVVGDALLLHATAENPTVTRVDLGVQYESALLHALDCDVLLLAVDRPWPRHVLNVISRAHLIPVLDAGIHVRSSSGTRLVGASWKVVPTGMGMRCLQCERQYDASEVALERSGQLDDPHYIAGLPEGHRLKGHENVAVFSMACASEQALQLFHRIIHPCGVPAPGTQTYQFVIAQLDSTPQRTTCDENCSVPTYELVGDLANNALGLLMDHP
jgi:molybdopterin-synthase adenylyltransferase